MILGACYSKGFHFWLLINGSSYAPQRALIPRNEEGQQIAQLPPTYTWLNFYTLFLQKPSRKMPTVYWEKICC